MIPLRDNNPSRRLPVVTWLLIAANAALFLYELTLGVNLESFLMSAAFIPARAHEAGVGGLAWEAKSALLSMFLHAGWMHFLGNMLFLWIFGDNVEDRLGPIRYLVFYLLCGYAAALGHTLSAPTSPLPAIGASGAIAGVLGAYLYLYPRARIVTLIFFGFFSRVVELPAMVYLLIWFGMQFLSGLASLSGAGAQQGGVAWFAHIGGFVAGPVLLLLLGGRRAPRNSLPPVDF
ncbi:MAG TPA: rhomboid family intramembrane serine protease [Thermoanaerobaculia bacterium]|nr:rhomboid family intramembrane serine protease [Thermoanaerobaculia bacterium]